jgi:hypothetical protein
MQRMISTANYILPRRPPLIAHVPGSSASIMRMTVRNRVVFKISKRNPIFQFAYDLDLVLVHYTVRTTTTTTGQSYRLEYPRT